MGRIYNFNPGPAVLPLPVLEQAQSELIDYRGAGMSVMEMSHRSKDYEAINADAEARVKRLLGLGEDYRVLFVQGGASLQFAMLPLNFLPAGATADYILSGSWAQKAIDEATKVGAVNIAATMKEERYTRMPAADEIALSEQPAYVHITSNETIQGVQWTQFPDVGAAPLVSDMSSDIMSRPFDAGKFALIYAGAQKNIGPSGVAVVIIRQSWIEQAATTLPGGATLPAILRYATFAKNNSLYNTPPSFAVYMVNLVLGWIEDQGGLAAIEQVNRQKADLIYAAIDGSDGFYRGHAALESRSMMNVTFRLPSEDLEKQFVSEAKAAGMVGLGGHRSVGGIRASIYNALTLEACQALAGFMSEFVQKNG